MHHPGLPHSRHLIDLEPTTQWTAALLLPPDPVAIPGSLVGGFRDAVLPIMTVDQLPHGRRPLRATLKPTSAFFAHRQRPARGGSRGGHDSGLLNRCHRGSPSSEYCWRGNGAIGIPATRALTMAVILLSGTAGSGGFLYVVFPFVSLHFSPGESEESHSRPLRCHCRTYFFVASAASPPSLLNW